jgi:hypothetical protein
MGRECTMSSYQRHDQRERTKVLGNYMEAHHMRQGPYCSRRTIPDRSLCQSYYALLSQRVGKDEGTIEFHRDSCRRASIPLVRNSDSHRIFLILPYLTVKESRRVSESRRGEVMSRYGWRFIPRFDASSNFDSPLPTPNQRYQKSHRNSRKPPSRPTNRPSPFTQHTPQT